MALHLRSPAFDNGRPLPADFARDGKDLSPPMNWSGVPDETQELVLICEDPDAPGYPSPFVHWVVYGIPPSVTGLPTGIHPGGRLKIPVVMDQGRNSFGLLGYGGPQPPMGDHAHHYFFRLYCVSRKLELGPGATRTEVLGAMKGAILAEAELLGRYERRARASA